ncbi:hypothetical protein ILYODFUR_016862 [Ilyodon furcidens]|uniref:Uncharacterized protein n=1 Tax=Ilyodon furcidens TaxID=33524 RepID=A0ABV0SQ85_9TELE
MLEGVVTVWSDLLDGDGPNIMKVATELYISRARGPCLVGWYVVQSLVQSLQQQRPNLPSIVHRELWDVLVFFFLTKLMNLCFKIPYSFKHLAQAESSHSSLVGCHYVHCHAPQTVKQTVI